MGIDFIISNAFTTLHGCGFLNNIMLFFSNLGDNGYLFLLLAVFFLPFKKYRKLSFGLIISAILILLVNNVILKKAIERPRPFVTYPEFIPYVLGELPTSYSFPSGHTAVNFAYAAFFCCYRSKYKGLAIFSSIFAAIVGFSRIYLIHHYFTDVMVGIIVGIGCGIAAYFLVPLLKKLFVKLKLINDCEERK